MTPNEAHRRLEDAKGDLSLARAIYSRPGIDPEAGIVSALDKVIALLQDALVNE